MAIPAPSSTTDERPAPVLDAMAQRRASPRLRHRHRLADIAPARWDLNPTTAAETLAPVLLDVALLDPDFDDIEAAIAATCELLRASLQPRFF